MSVVHAVEIKCNGPHPSGGECPDSAAWMDYGTAADLRERMANAGWATSLRFGYDRCPKCRSTPTANS